MTAAPGVTFTPAYGLETTTIDPDAKTTTSSYTDTPGGIDPALRLPTTVTQDPGGLNLTTSTRYENPTSPLTWLRATSKTLPAGNATDYRHYCGTPNTCGAGQQPGAYANTCAVTANSPQYGLLAEMLEPAQTPGGPRRAQQFVYDSAGRTAGRRVAPQAAIAAAPWQCTSYDLFGRITSQVWPATQTASARTVTYSYNVGGNPLTASVSDPNGTITATVDILGRQTSHTDANGWTTTYTYDSGGRPQTTTSGPGGTNHTTTTNTYDPGNGRLTQVTSTVGATTYTGTISYLIVGLVDSVTWSPGSIKRINYTYDDYARIGGIVYTNNGAPFYTDEAAYSLAGRRTQASIQSTTGLIDPHPGDDFITTAPGGSPKAGSPAPAWTSATPTPAAPFPAPARTPIAPVSPGPPPPAAPPTPPTATTVPTMGVLT